MGHPILEENQAKRLTIGLPLLICFAMFCAWQMGVVYFTGPALSVDGRTPLPVSVDNMTLIIAAGYALSLAVMLIRPQLTVRIQRIACSAALLSVLALFFPFPPETLVTFFYLQSFFCVFMIVFEAGIIINLFTGETAIKHLLVAYAIAYNIIAALHNDFVPVPFPVFRLFSLAALTAMLFFFFWLPAKTWPRYAKKSDGLVRPRQFFLGIYILVALDCFMTLFGSAVAESIPHGVAVYYCATTVYGLGVFFLWKRFGVSPLRSVSVLVALGALGFVAAIASLYVPALGLAACVLAAGGMTVLVLNPFWGLLLAKRYPSRFITPITIGIAFGTVLVHSGLLEAFRNNRQFLYIVYLVIAVALAIVYLVLEPYLIYSFRGRSLVPESGGGLFSGSQEKKPGDSSSAAESASGAGTGPAETFQAHAADHLSGQEIRLAELIMQGYSNSEMAAILHITGNTVKGYRKTLYSKLQIHSRRELFELAERIIPLRRKG